MEIDREMIISILKLTKHEPVSQDLIQKDANLPRDIASKLLRKMQKQGLLYVEHGVVSADAEQRLLLAVGAIQAGAVVERVAEFLEWGEFEEIAAVAFEREGYIVARNLRFSSAGKRFEVDVVACKRPLVVCVDCKHWHHVIHISSLKRIVGDQLERTRMLAKSTPSPRIRISCSLWQEATFVPVVLSLVQGEYRFYDRVPVVAVLQLRDFVNQLLANAHTLRTFPRRMAKLS